MQVKLGEKIGNVLVSGNPVEDELPEHIVDSRDSVYKQDADRVHFVFGKLEEKAQPVRGLLCDSSRMPSALAAMKSLLGRQELFVVVRQRSACLARVGMLDPNDKYSPFSGLNAENFRLAHIVSTLVLFRLAILATLFAVYGCPHVAYGEDPTALNLHVAIDCGLNHVGLDAGITGVCGRIPRSR